MSIVGRRESIFSHEIISAGAGVLAQNQYTATTWGSDRTHYIPWEGEAFLLVVQTDNAPTGSTPTVTVAVQVSEDGGAWGAPTGGAVTTSAISTATTSVIVAPGGTAFQSGWAIGAHKENLRVLVTVANADNVVNGLSVELVFLY